MGGEGSGDSSLWAERASPWYGGGITSIRREDGHLCLKPRGERQSVPSPLETLRHRGVSRLAVGFLRSYFPSR